jgi:hypothetical protein
MKDYTTRFLFLILILFCWLLAAVSRIDRLQKEVREIQGVAIERGYGSFILVNGEIEFQWIDKEDTK